MRIGSLFSGYSGLDLAVEQVIGATPAWFVENEAAPSRVLAHHWPDIPNHGDITAIDWSSVEPVEIVTAGYPCQPFSSAGQRRGVEDEGSMTIRRPGGRWRLLVHEWIGRRPDTDLLYGTSHGVEPGPERHESDHYVHHQLPDNTEFDELVVGQWLHIEAMTASTWWMNIGGVTVHVTADRDGRPKRVTVAGPGDYDEARDGCEYECVWSHGEEADE